MNRRSFLGMLAGVVGLVVAPPLPVSRRIGENVVVVDGDFYGCTRSVPRKTLLIPPQLSKSTNWLPFERPHIEKDQRRVWEK